MGNLDVNARDSVSHVTRQKDAQKSKEYSKDGKLWVGMTQKDAYLDDELSKLFSYADVNKDRVLDKDEIARYNGPTLVTSDKGTYYPGLLLEQVPQGLQEAFKEIDSAPRDGIIQENEIQEYADKKKILPFKNALIGGTVVSAACLLHKNPSEHGLFDTWRIKSPAWKKAARVINKMSSPIFFGLLAGAAVYAFSQEFAGIKSYKESK